MKNRILITLACVLLAGSIFAANPKREFRSVWLTTVWAIDWPATRAATDAAATAQKKQMTDYLDKFQQSGMNAVFFQVRTMCDAFYQSSYEPWSQWMCGTRGVAPKYDPLTFAIEEAHKRGMELHAWINPYRYSSGESTYGKCSNDYSQQHPDWIITCANGSTILNPGMPEVRQRIVDVVMDIVNRYDVDGIVFDDYFYVQGMTDAMDQTQYNKYNPKGLNRADWRRDNVNQMVADVNSAIKAKKPWCKFGIGPAGIAASKQSVADKYGITAISGTEGDWQYDGIYSEPVAWLKANTIDYISPQVYWTIGSALTDYSKITPWWYNVANKFGRHCYISHSLSSWGTKFWSDEVLNQIAINRAGSAQASGSVFYQGSNYSKGTLPDTLKNFSYSTKALTPALTWYSATTLAAPTNLTLSSTTLSWQHASAPKFSVYAYPKGTAKSVALANPAYLLGVSYSKTFDVSSVANRANMTFAVCALDRFGNEYEPAFYNQGTEPDVPECNEYGWKTKGEMCLALQEDYNTKYNKSFQWAKSENGKVYYHINDQWLKEDLAAGQEGTVTNFIQYCTYTETQNFINLVSTPSSRWYWLYQYVQTVRTAQGLTGDITDAIVRKEVSGFFLCSPANTQWPKASDYSVAGKYSAFQSAWGEVFCSDSHTTPIESVQITSDSPVRVYNIMGEYMGANLEGLPHGVYIVTNGNQSQTYKTIN